MQFRERLDDGEDLDDIMLEAFAVVPRGRRRVIGQRHFDVQLMGGAALHFGWIAEMKTGEGKTLVSTLPVYLNGLSGRGIHIITVNDYLATLPRRVDGPHPQLARPHGRPHRARATATPTTSGPSTPADITYGTNNEFGFDYLRDNMAHEP